MCTASDGSSSSLAGVRIETQVEFREQRCAPWVGPGRAWDRCWAGRQNGVPPLGIPETGGFP
jgi:hypothetical protein